MYQRIRDLREDRDLLQKDVAAYLKNAHRSATQLRDRQAGYPHRGADPACLVSTIPVPIIFSALRTTAPRPSPAKRKLPPKQRDLMRATFGGSLFDVKIFHYGPAWKGSCKRVHTGLSVKNDFSRLSKASRKQSKESPTIIRVNLNNSEIFNVPGGATPYSVFRKGF